MKMIKEIEKRIKEYDEKFCKTPPEKESEKCFMNGVSWGLNQALQLAKQEQSKIDEMIKEIKVLSSMKCDTCGYEYKEKPTICIEENCYIKQIIEKYTED